MKDIVILYSLLLIYTKYNAQDIHWSQPGSILLYQNPAFAGATGKYSLGVDYRDQWNSVNKSYNTFIAAGDYRFEPNKEKATISAGGLAFRDASADGNYVISSLGFALSCLVSIDERSKFGAGLSYNFMQSSLNKDNFTWGNQYDGQAYNSSFSTGEIMTASNKSFSDLILGVTFVYHEKEGTVSDNSPDIILIGYNVSHITRPEIAINGSSDRLAIKHSFMLTGTASLQDNLGLKPTLLFQYQGKMLEILGGSLIRMGLGQVSRYTGIRKGSSFSAGLLYRFKDALIPAFEFEKSNYSIGLSYDVNLSKLSKASRYKGGVEICLRFKPVNKILNQDKKSKADNTKTMN